MRSKLVCPLCYVSPCDFLRARDEECRCHVPAHLRIGSNKLDALPVRFAIAAPIASSRLAVEREGMAGLVAGGDRDGPERLS